MKKLDLIFLFFIALLILSINFIFQADPGYMDSEYYFLGGLQITKGENTIPVIWNYLDNPDKLPHLLFTYWMPLASILSSFSMFVFGSTFIGSRVIFWLLAAGIAPLSYVLGYKLTQNRFVGLLASAMAVFSGYYFKFFTIPETIIPSIYLGSIFFIILSNLNNDSINNKKKLILIILLGIISGLLHLSRSDGVIFFLLGVCGFFFYYLKNRTNFKFIQLFFGLCLYLLSYLVIMGGLFYYNMTNFGSLFSPATSKALWLASYDDTFIYPASKLSFNYFLENGLSNRFSQIFEAFKLNVGSFIGVQLLIVGIPLFIIGMKRNFHKLIIRIATIHIISIFLLMTVIFPFAGSRGGYLHASAANQILVWVLIADGLYGFIEWGINKRNWVLQRSKWMFGSAFVIIILLFTIFIYQKDVVGSNVEEIKWQNDYKNYEFIESIIEPNSIGKDDVVMINNPIGYYYKTGRWSVVIPNANVEDFNVLIEEFNIRYIVIDKNLPEKFNSDHFLLIEKNFILRHQDKNGLKIYEKNS